MLSRLEKQVFETIPYESDCLIGCKQIAQNLGISEVQVLTILNKLMSKWLVQRSHYYDGTGEWYYHRFEEEKINDNLTSTFPRTGRINQLYRRFLLKFTPVYYYGHRD